MLITPTVLVNSQHLPANLLDAVLESKLMSFTYTVLAEYWRGLMYCISLGAQIFGGSSPLGPMKSAPMLKSIDKTNSDSAMKAGDIWLIMSVIKL